MKPYWSEAAHFNKFKHFGPKFGPQFFNHFKRPKYNVPLNVIENEDNFEVLVYALGFSKEQITVSVTNDELLIEGKKEVTDAPKFSIQEFPIKHFERKLALNNQVNVEDISAKSDNGVLIITLPKSDLAKRTKTNIEVN